MARVKKAIISAVKTGKLKGQFRFTLTGKNGKVIGQSYPETYTQKQNCISTLKANLPDFKIMDETA